MPQPPWTPPPPPTKVAIVGKHAIYDSANLVGPFLVHKLLGPSPPPPFALFNTSLAPGYGLRCASPR